MKNQFIAIALWAGFGLFHFSLTVAAQPVATTLAATSITSSNAILNGSANPEGVATAVYLQYGLTTNYDNESLYIELPATTGTVSIPGQTAWLRGAAGTNWTLTSAPLTNWYAVASSADGTHLAAAVDAGGIYTSTNSGKTWALTSAPGEPWNCIASSADGTHLAAGVGEGGNHLGGGVYFSTNSGASWAPASAPANYWLSMAAAADSLFMVAASLGDDLYISTNGGGAWVPLAAFAPGGQSGADWSAVACSADGSHLVAGTEADNDIIYTSANGGTTWTDNTAPDLWWSAMVSSADGTHLAAGAIGGGGVYTSANSGSTWTATSLANSNCPALASSADGSRLTAGISGGDIYISVDSGATWTPANAPNESWQGIAASTYGTQLAAAANGGGLYISTGPTNNLASGTTYHFRLVAINSAGISQGNDLTFTTSPGAPTATTVSANSITATNAALIGSILTGGSTTSAYFRYGLTTSYGSYSTTNSVAATTGSVSVTNLIGNLAPATTYHFQLVAVNSGGTAFGNDVTFTTGAAAPIAVTGSATGIAATSATLNGTVNTEGATATAYFQYGLTTNYGSYTITNTLAATNVPVAVAALAANLLPGTVGHFRLVANNGLGISVGNDQTFTTSPGAPGATTQAASGVTATSATLNGTVFTGDLATSVYFRYGLTVSYGSYSTTNTLAAVTAQVPTTNLTGNLSPGTTYHFELVASNTAGTSLGGDLTLTTPPLPPVVTTLAATSITATNGTLNGTVNPEGAFATAYFQYGLTTNYNYLGGYTTVPYTNTAQTLPGFVTSPYGPAGTNWTLTSAPSNAWYSVASSADGTHLAAVVNGGGIYTSTNRGSTWALSAGAPLTNWEFIASSANGLRLAAAAGYAGIYLSTNGGSSWTLSEAPGLNWQSIASSADGLRLVAGQQEGTLYTSANGGASWTNTTSNGGGDWTTLASSGDGTVLVAGDGGFYGGGYVSISTNSGVTWGQAGGLFIGVWNIAAAADGVHLAAWDGNVLYLSTNSGAAWTGQGGISEYLNCLGISADGTRLAGGVNGGGIYVSLDGGATWTMSDAPVAQWQSIAPSADGSQWTAVAYDGGIYASTGASNHLAPGTVYHFRAVGLNSVATGFGNDLTFTTAAGAPTATTLSVTNITATNATVVGSVFTGDLVASAYFQYGLTTNYGSYSATNTLAASTTSLFTTNVISNLSPGAVYHFHLAAVNSAGTSLGGDLSFTTLPLPPVVTTLAATGITTTNGTLNGTVNPEGAFTTAYFQYGLTTNYGNLNGFTVFSNSNTTQTLPGLVLNSLQGGAGTNWTQTSAPSTNWQAIASSADGTRLAAVVSSTSGSLSVGGIYTSTNGGITWIQTAAPVEYWTSIASSADGVRLAATVSGGVIVGIYTSTNAGVAWTPQTNSPDESWVSIASSADGMRLAAVASDGIYTSTNAGVTWTLTSAPAPGSDNAWQAIASSADGTRLAAGQQFGSIYISTNSGAAWTQASGTSSTFTSIACSANGMTMVAGTAQYLLVSSNGGLTWSYDLSAPNAEWWSVACAANGSRLAAVENPGGIYFSTDDNTWTPGNAPGNATWHAIASSADGSKLAAGAGGGSIYTSAGQTNSLTPGTTCHYQVVGLNIAGTTLGNDLTFTTSPAIPAATTLAASNVSATTATLNGTVNPNGAVTTAYFQYGLTTSYGSYSSTNTFATTNIVLSVTNLVSSLAPATIYHFRLLTSNSAGTNAGADLSFTTGAAVPTATTLAASSITATNASLNGTVNPNGAVTTAYFQYGLTMSYGSYSATNTLAATNVTLSVTNLIGSLAPGTTYHFRVLTSNSVGTNAGVDLSFTTGAAVPTATTLAASSITATNGDLNGTVNPNGAATTAYFQYGLTTSYGSYSTTNSLTATNVVLSVTNLISSLTPGTTYHFRLLANNSVGTNAGADMQFTTAAAVPTATTLAASSITATNGDLNGTINPNGAATTAYFQYGLTTSYGSYSTTNSLAATNVVLSVTNLISSLSPGTTYHFRLLANNSAGTNAGTDMQFITSAQAQAVNFTLSGATILAGGAFQLRFTNLDGLSFTVLASTNLALTNWTTLGAPAEAPPGQYEFTDTQATNSATRFYRVTSP